MKRFIDLGGQLYTTSREDRELHCFAWYDTVIDQFEAHSDSQAWTYWEEFVKDFQGADLLRYRALCPAWVFAHPEER